LSQPYTSDGDNNKVALTVRPLGDHGKDGGNNGYYSDSPRPHINNGKPALFNSGKVKVSSAGTLLPDGDGGNGKEALSNGVNDVSVALLPDGRYLKVAVCNSLFYGIDLDDEPAASDVTPKIAPTTSRCVTDHDR
jgi:hypothetical protein